MPTDPSDSDSFAWSLAALRVSLGLLMVIWGADKLANPAHGVGVAERFYFGLPLSTGIMPFLGVAQIGLGVGIVLGIFRQVLYPVLALTTGVTLLGVWASIVDPWGWYLDGTNSLFFPSLIVFAGALVTWAAGDHDRIRFRRSTPNVAAQPAEDA